MADWDSLVGTLHLEDERYAALWKTTPEGPAWSRVRVKAAVGDVFRDMDAAGELGELLAVVETDTARIALDACRMAVPEWASEFVERFNEKVEQMAGPGVMPRFEISDAVRGIRNIIIGLAGAPGGGKTCSALRLATGLANGGEIVLIDTECGRSTEFAPRPGEVIGKEFDPELPLFHFKRIDLTPPYTPARYRLAVAAASRLKPAVLIIDNITDEHMGEGGMLDMVDSKGSSAFNAWNEPKSQHRALMNKLRTHPWYVILTVRAHEKSTMEKKYGKTEVVYEGWQPQCVKGLAFDCTVFQLVDGGVPNGATERPWKLPGSLRRLVPAGKPLTEETGKLIREWCQPEGSWENGVESDVV